MPARAAVVLTVLVALAVTAGCSSGEKTARSTTTVSSVSTTSSTSTTAATTSSGSASTPPVTAIPTDQSGRIFALVKSYDPVAHTIVVDVAQYMSGDEYKKYLVADPERWNILSCGPVAVPYDGTQDLATCEPDGQSQGYKNESKRLRTLSVAAGATFEAPRDNAAQAEPMTGEEFSAYLAGGASMGDTFWLWVKDGWVTSVEFQYFA